MDRLALAELLDRLYQRLFDWRFFLGLGLVILQHAITLPRLLTYEHAWVGAAPSTCLHIWHTL